MSADISYTTEEIAKLLKISKLTVYDLIKKGELPSYRVGKQIRIDASDLEAYKLRAKGLQANAPAGKTMAFQPQGTPYAHAQDLSDRSAASYNAGGGGGRPIVITGQDMSLDILAKHIEREGLGVRPLRSYVGSMDSLVSMYKGESDIVSTHLLDGDTGEYNVPYIRKLLIGAPYIVVHLLTRSAGLFVQQGNPLKLASWADLVKPGLRLINRERGAGARVLLDEQLRLHNIPAASIVGYDQEQTNHLGVAAQVASGEADVGIGTERAAAVVSRITYIPLIQEQYDLVMLKKPDNQVFIDAVIRILQSQSFKQELGAITGYDLTRTGEIVAES
ncbi:putative molybdopterin biosynthesis protein [Paenibacillus algorifonticola]|uniref:Putative molybdopterin biosynthesis protein n=1 Tax=Paenibacillus algorifonticola TaxID=684063 RepID=A0A1I2DSA8_9BACL|nr:helix-turn-helix transcriptional regulator [Paenibacillus algorifonticola]SFE82810.1 putative molybdopterin biosynthesis protein [Paenibacillus algorifonticola]